MKCHFKGFGLYCASSESRRKIVDQEETMICVLTLFYKENSLLAVEMRWEADDEGPRETARWEADDEGPRETAEGMVLLSTLNLLCLNV
jgi:hypothetical protein